MKVQNSIAVILMLLSVSLYGQNVESLQQDQLQQQEGPFPCINGMAGDYPCDGYDLQGRLTNAEMGGGNGNDCWGWVDPLDGKEYALMGLTNGTAFVDISDPTNPIHLGNLPTQTGNSLWRDLKVYQNYAFIVSEASFHGMQVFDLTKLRDVVSPPVTFTVDFHYDGFGNSHNVVLNESTGYVYPVGTSGFAGGPHFINISNPLNPTLEGGYDGDGYTHDAQVVSYIGPDPDHQNKEIFFGSNTNTLTIVDITDKTDPIQLSRETYTGVAYTHQGWLTEDHKYFLMDDEVDEGNFGINTRTLIWDVQDLDNPFYIGDFDSSIGASDHNLYVHNGLAYQANYLGGLRVLDLSDVANANLTEVGYFDTYPESNNSGFSAGAWSNYPYFPSGNIIISTQDRGLFIVKASNNTNLVNLELDLNLEGPFDAASGTMNDALRVSGNIPLTEPYSALGYTLPSVSTTNAILSVTGNDAIVDWILVELRDNVDPTIILDSQAALLQRDGDIVAADGNAFLVFDPVASGMVRVAVRHRNHFGIRTTNSFSTSSTISIDFTDPTLDIFGSNPVIEVAGENVLIGGDANDDGQVNAIDKNSFWRLQNANPFDYGTSRADFNLDGSVNSVDKNTLWRLNNSKTGQLD